MIPQTMRLTDRRRPKPSQARISFTVPLSQSAIPLPLMPTVQINKQLLWKIRAPGRAQRVKVTKNCRPSSSPPPLRRVYIDESVLSIVTNALPHGVGLQPA
jgi:hypothetical protein